MRTKSGRKIYPCSPNHQKLDLWSRRHFLKTVCWLTASVCPLVGNFFSRVSNADEGINNKGKKRSRSTGTGFVFDNEYLRHTLGPGHPESPKRLKAILKRLETAGLEKALKFIAPTGVPMPHIKIVHPDPHIKLVIKQAHDESICRLAVAGALSAVDAVCTGEVLNAFCAIRPPGHHATDTGEYGFCFYNNVAIAARYAQQKYGLKRILIADWDYHHGNGTEWAFYQDPTVLFFSTHALYAFPGTGYSDKTGKGKGQGFNINVPLPHGASDRAILNAFAKRLVPAADRFQPDLVLISAGFDSRKDDLLGDFAVTDEGFYELTKLMMSIAETHSHSRVVSLLEGGYNTQGLALAVESHLRALLR